MSSVAAAIDKYQLFRDTEFRQASPPQTPSTELRPTPRLAYQSPIADQYYVGCGIDIIPVCAAVVRYANYFIFSTFDIQDVEVDGVTVVGDGLLIEQVEPVLRALDQLAATRLGLAPRPTRDP